MIVTSPLSATVTVVPAGKPGFAFSTSSFTLSFSSCVSWVVSSTFVTSGVSGVVFSAIVATTVVCISELTFLPISSWVIFTTESFTSGLSSSTSHSLSCFTVVVFLVPSGRVTSIFAPSSPAPIIFTSSESIVSTVGSADVFLFTTV